MSFILDALKKSETERQQQTGAEFAGVPTSSGDARPMRWLWLLIALLGINLAVLLGLLLRPDVQSAGSVAFDETASREAATAAELVVEDPAAVSAPTFEEQIAEARQAETVPAGTGQQAETEILQERSVNVAPATTVAAPSPTRSARVPTIDELRLAGALQLPELHLDIHVYSEEPAERFVFINMMRHREQSQLAEGPLVREIVSDGVILEHQGRTFLLPRE